jgi:hypothetical protein
MRRIHILAMTAAMVALTAFGAFPASAQTFLDGVDGTPPCTDGTVQIDGRCVFTVSPTTGVPVGVAPAEQEFSIRRLTSGAANPVTRISNTGDNVNLCTPVQQVANTGNVANEQGVVEDNSGGFSTNGFDTFGFDRGFDRGFGRGGDLDFTGSEINIDPTATAECVQTINQAAAA